MNQPEPAHYRQRPVPNWTYIIGGHGRAGGHLVYHDQTLKCQLLILTERDEETEKWGKAEHVYSLIGDVREFATEDEMIDALMDGPAELWVHAGTTRQPINFEEFDAHPVANPLKPKKKPMPSPVIVGIDPSLTNTAVCAGTREHDYEIRCFPSKKLGDTVADRMRRLENLVSGIDRWLAELKPAAIFIEGYSFGSRVGGEYLGEYGGVLRWHAVDHARHVFEVPPSTLKKFITGSGAGKKDMVIAHVTHKWGRIFKTNDEVDAFALYQFGLAAVGAVEMTNAAQRDSVEKVLGHRRAELLALAPAAVPQLPPAF